MFKVFCRFAASDHILLVVFFFFFDTDALNAADPARTTPDTAGIWSTYPEGFLTWTGGLFDQVVPMTFHGNIVQQFSEHDALSARMLFTFESLESIAVLSTTF